MNDAVKICIYPDDEVGAIAVVLLWHDESDTWYNSGIVVNEANPIIAFQKALGMAIAKGYWQTEDETNENLKDGQTTNENLKDGRT